MSFLVKFQLQKIIKKQPKTAKNMKIIVKNRGFGPEIYFGPSDRVFKKPPKWPFLGSKSVIFRPIFLNNPRIHQVG